MSTFKIVTDFNNVNRKEWSEFVKNHPNGNIFQTPCIFDVYQKTKKYDPLLIIVLDIENTIVGLQVSVVEKTYNNFLGYFTSRSIIKGGPLVLNENKNILDLILKKYIRVVKGKAIYSQFRNMWDWSDLKNVYVRNKISFEDHLDIIFDLTKGEEVLLKEMKRVRRKGIKQSNNKGVIVKEIDLSNDRHLVESYSILKNVYQRIKLPLPNIDFFRNVQSYFGDKLFSLGLYVEDELIAIRIVFCYKKLIYDWYAGAKDEFLDFRPNDVLPWEIMKWGIKNKYEVFDFGGAGKPNILPGIDLNFLPNDTNSN